MTKLLYPGVLISLEMENFHSVSHSKIVFPSGVLGVVGEVDEDAEKSNGAGKSTLVEAVLVAWFGQGRVDIFNCIKDDADEMNLILEWCIEAGGREIHYKVKRYSCRSKREHKRELFIDHSETPFGGGKTATDKYIIELLGMDFTTMVATNVFMQRKDDAFTAAKPSVRKDYLKTVYDTSLWDRAHRIALDKLDDLKKEFQSSTANRNTYEKELESLKNIDFATALTEAQKNLRQCDEALQHYNRARRETQDELTKLQTMSEGHSALTQLIEAQKNRLTDIDKAKEANTQGISDTQQKMAVLDKLRAEKEITNLVTINEDEVQKWKEQLQGSVANRGVATAQKQAADVEIERIKKIGPVCDKCRRPMPVEEAQAAVDAEIVKIQKADFQMEQCTKSIDEINGYLASVDKLREENATKQNRLATIEAELKREPELANLITTLTENNSSLKVEKEKLTREHKANLEKLKQLPVMREDTIQGFEESIKDLDAKIEGADKIKDQYNEHIGSLTERERRKNQLQDAIKQIDDSSKDIRERLRKRTIQAEAYSKNGIPALIVDNSFPVLQASTNNILKDLEPTRSVTFSSLKEKVKGGQVESMEIWINNHVKNTKRIYETYSGGESTFINLAIRKALSDSLANRKYKRLPFLILDEVFAALDVRSRGRILKTINMLELEFKQILIISHTDLQSAFPNVIRAVKKGEDTVYVQ